MRKGPYQRKVIYMTDDHRRRAAEAIRQRAQRILVAGNDATPEVEVTTLSVRRPTDPVVCPSCRTHTTMRSLMWGGEHYRCGDPDK